MPCATPRTVGTSRAPNITDPRRGCEPEAAAISGAAPPAPAGCGRGAGCSRTEGPALWGPGLGHPGAAAPQIRVTAAWQAACQPGRLGQGSGDGAGGARCQPVAVCALSQELGTAVTLEQPALPGMLT